MEASEEDEEALEVVSAAVAQDEEAVSAVVASAEDSAKTWRENFKQMCLSIQDIQGALFSTITFDTLILFLCSGIFVY